MGTSYRMEPILVSRVARREKRVLGFLIATAGVGISLWAAWLVIDALIFINGAKRLPGTNLGYLADPTQLDELSQQVRFSASPDHERNGTLSWMESKMYSHVGVGKTLPVMIADGGTGEDVRVGQTAHILLPPALLGVIGVAIAMLGYEIVQRNLEVRRQPTRLYRFGAAS